LFSGFDGLDVPRSLKTRLMVMPWSARLSCVRKLKS